MEITRGIRRIGAGLVNVYLVEDAGEVTIIDAGAPSYWGDLPAELAAMGCSLEDVRAVVLTHAHPDHIGFAERIRAQRGVPIHVHEQDASLARGEEKARGQQRGPIRPIPLLRFLWFAARHGMLRIPSIAEVSTFGDGANLDVPAAPRVILVPGHTQGSAALHVPSLDALFVGDAFATINAVNGRRGPQLAPFGSDRAMALDSLSRIESVESDLVLPGHGLPWTAGVAEAARQIRTMEAAR